MDEQRRRERRREWAKEYQRRIRAERKAIEQTDRRTITGFASSFDDDIGNDKWRELNEQEQAWLSRSAFCHTCRQFHPAHRSLGVLGIAEYSRDAMSYLQP